MWPAILSAAGTFSLWLIFVVGGFVCAAYLFSRLVTRFIPTGQERLPRHLWTLASLVLAILIGGYSGLQVASSQAALAFGDSLSSAGRFEILTPWPADDNVLDTPARMMNVAREEWDSMDVRLVALRVARHFALGSFWEPLAGSYLYGREYLRLGHQYTAAPPEELAREAWLRSRPGIARVAREQLIGSLLTATLYLTLLMLGGVLLLALSHGELRRAVHRQ